jgi:hypothetical protein
MAVDFNILRREGPANLLEGFMAGQQEATQNALAQQKIAQERDLMSMRRQEFQANLESSQAERRRKAQIEKTAMFRDRLLRASSPQAARDLIRMQHSDPDLGPLMQQFGTLEQDLADIPDDPSGFENWRSREAMGAAEFIRNQASERGFQDLLSRLKGNQPDAGAAAPVNTMAAAPGAAPVNAMVAASGTTRRTPERIASEIDILSQSTDPRAKAMAARLMEEYKFALKPPTEFAPPEIVRLQQYLGQLTPGSAEYTAVQDRIKMLTTRPEPTKVSVTVPPQPKAEQTARGSLLVEQYKTVSDAARLAQRTIPALETQANILDTGFRTGFGTDVKAAGASVLAALGVKEAEKFATDAQTFLAATQQAVLQRQLEQKGPQTEADAQRITQTAAQRGNTPEANRFLIDIAKAQLKRDIEQRNFYDKWWKANNTYDGAEDAWFSGEGGRSLFDRPELKKYAPNRPSAAEQIPGPQRPAGRPAAPAAATRSGATVSNW